MSYRTYEINPDQSGASNQPNRNEYVPLGHPGRIHYNCPAPTVRYVTSNQPSYNTGHHQPHQFTRGIDRRDARSASPRRGVDRRRSSANEPLMVRRQRRIEEIADNLPLRTHREFPNTARNIYTQDRVFEHSSRCRHVDGRFYCYCGFSTARQVESINRATPVHRAPTPYVCPVCGVHCPRGLYQYNDHLQAHHPGLVQYAALQYRDDRFVRRDGSYYG